MSEQFPPMTPDPEPWRPGQERFPLLAGYGQRLTGRILDGLVLIAPFLLWVYVLTDPGQPRSDSLLSFYALALAFSFANDVALTALTGGSIGKRIVGTRVVLGDEQKPITMGVAFLRWFVMMLLNVIPFGGIFDAVYIFTGEGRRQTLHDRAAGTSVVRVTL